MTKEQRIAEIENAVDLVAAAEGALCRARRHFPERGKCSVRAVIDVELGNLRRSRQHILSARSAVRSYLERHQTS